MDVSYNMWYNNLGADGSGNDLMEFYYPYSYFYEDTDGSVFAEFIVKIHAKDTIVNLVRPPDDVPNKVITLTLNIKKEKSPDKGWDIVYFDTIKIDPPPPTSTEDWKNWKICIKILPIDVNDAQAQAVVRYGDVAGPTTN